MGPLSRMGLGAALAAMVLPVEGTRRSIQGEWPIASTPRDFFMDGARYRPPPPPKKKRNPKAAAQKAQRKARKATRHAR